MTDTTNDQQPDWFIDEGVPGIGQRPTWLNDKFKTVADLAKGYTELEKRFGTIPEDYDLSKSKYIDADYAHFQDLKKLAKERRVPKDVMDKMVEAVDKYMDEFQIDYKEEIQKLGPNANERLELLNNWAKANLSEESYKALTSSMNRAESVKAIEELRNKMMSNTLTVPNGHGDTPTAASIEELQQELVQNLEKYKTDDKYRKDLQNRMEVAAKNNPGYIDKIGA